MNLILLMPIALLLLSLIVVVHELGHYIAAKLSGVFVEEFGVGFPPRAWAKKIGETLYSLNWLPIGGFVRLHGETIGEKVTEPTRAFTNKSAKARIFIALAGVFMNFLLAVVCFSVAYSFEGIEKQTENVRITDISAGSPAQQAGLIVDDVVRVVNKDKITAVDQFIGLINENRGKRVTIEVDRKVGDTVESKKFTITPRENPPEGEGSLGVSITTIEIYFPPVWQRPILGAKKGIEDTVMFTREVFFGFAKLSQQVTSGQSPEGLVGFVGILSLMSKIFTYGFLPALKLTGIISLNLAVINLLPFPPLDGSRVLFVIIEKIFGKKSVPKIEAKLHPIGMVILLILMLLITGRELTRLIQAGSISGFVDSLVK